MTFEVHRKRLGIVAYTPRARCSTEDPHRLRDYAKQVQRWYLGLWQTVYSHGLWPSLFSVALAAMLADMAFVAVFHLALPLAILASLTVGMSLPAISLGGQVFVDPLRLACVMLALDYFLTCVVAAIQRRPVMLIYGLAFPALRLLDMFLFLQAMARATRKSDGSWVSPLRLAQARQASVLEAQT